MKKIITTIAYLSVIGLVSLSAKDLSKAEFLAVEKADAEKNGWRFKEDKASALFEKMDTNKDGVATSKERKHYWDNWSKNK
ncbi:MAG: hypothetical protein ACSHX8_08950 [Opitutaceae bacterium]